MYQTSLTKGQELVAQRMVRELRRQGHEAYLITGGYHDGQPVPSAEEIARRGYLQSFDEELGIPIVRVKSHNESWPPRRIAFEGFVANLARIVDDLSLDVLITHSTLWNGPEDTAKFVEWRRNQVRGGAPVRKLVFCHMSHFQEPSDEMYDLNERTFREAWNSTSLPTIMRLADYVLVTTPHEMSQMKDLGVDPSKCLLFPGGIDSLRMEGEDSDFRMKYGLPPLKKLVTYLGTVEERKNPGAILEVARSLESRDDLHFVVAGKPEGAYGHGVRAKSEGLPNLTVIGPIPDEDTPSLIKESYLNINMSRSEALGLSQLEFMFHGVPVVTSGVGGQSWLVKNGTSGVVLRGPDDISGAAEAISKLADDEEKRDKLGKRAKETATQFTMPELIKDLAGRINSKLVALGEVAAAFDPGERILEAWAMKGERVVVTTKNLIIETAKGGRAVLVPISEIAGVSVRRRFSKKLLVAGAFVTLGLYGTDLVGVPWLLYLESAIGRVSNSQYPALGGLGLAIALLPLALSLAYVAMKARRGYSLSYGDGVAFLPEEFSRALRIVDQLTSERAFMELPPN
jgi:D-inositol-3-phosphate glycosyltransferase